jgi:hypothetical protein
MKFLPLFTSLSLIAIYSDAQDDRMINLAASAVDTALLLKDDTIFAVNRNTAIEYNGFHPGDTDYYTIKSLPLVLKKNVAIYLTRFNTKANFSNTIFESDADFGNDVFRDTADFFNTVFKNSLTFCIDARTGIGTQFQGPAYFTGAFFEGKADFSCSQFMKDVFFNEKNGEDFIINRVAADITILAPASFSKNVSFFGAVFNRFADFNSVKFDTLVDFSCASFKNEANFERAEFKQIASFTSQCFPRTGFFSTVSFSNAIFRNIALFSYVNFDKAGNFSSILFDSDAIFKGSVFKDRVDFSKTTFQKNVDFTVTKFGTKAIFSDLNLSSQSSFNFYLTVLPDTLDFSSNPELIHEINLTKANFYDTDHYDTNRDKYVKPHYLILYKTDISKYHLDYIYPFPFINA